MSSVKLPDFSGVAGTGVQEIALSLVGALDLQGGVFTRRFCQDFSLGPFKAIGRQQGEAV